MSTVIALTAASAFWLHDLWARLFRRETETAAGNVVYAQNMGRAYPVGLTLAGTATDGQALAPLLPFLARLTRQRKWVVLVSPPFRVPESLLVQAGIVPSRFMVVDAKSPEARSWAVQQALRNCPGGAVLFWPSSPPEASLKQRIDAAAWEGQSSCISFDIIDNSLIKIKKAA